MKEIVFTGTRVNIEKAKNVLRSLFAIEANHYCKLEWDKHIPKILFDEIREVCVAKFRVLDVSQHSTDTANVITIKGKKCRETKKWLMEKLRDLLRMQFPHNWVKPVTQFLNGDNLRIHVLSPADPDWNRVEANFLATMPNSSVLQI